MYTVVATNKFKKDYKLCLKRGLDVSILEEVVSILEEKGKLPENYKPHVLKGNFKGLYECHIQPDWLLIWQLEQEIKLISLIRTGSHSDLF
jgi:mRNA interferase YafQ